MGDPLPPDPYIALGVAKDATAAAIKTQYRKLVLKFHPDKVQDESQKQAAADQFHKIQTAYEIVSDEARRARYDAQCKLAELRKDVMDRDKGGRKYSDDERSPRYASQPEPARDYPTRERSARTSPQYSTEERRPSYAPQDYFDPEPTRPTSRKESEYGRTSKRTPPAKEKSSSKSSKAGSIFGGKKKDDKSSRKEKSRKSDRDVKQDRERKWASTTVEEDTGSDSDPYERRRKQMEVEDELRRVKQAYYEHERRQREQADSGYFGDERTRKLFSQSNDARDYIHSGRTPRSEYPERRPSPVRMSSSRDHVEQRRPSPPRMSSSRDGVEYVKRSSDRPPVMIRRGSGRPQTAGHSSERRTRDAEAVDEPVRDAKRPPPLAHTKSSPPVVQPETTHRPQMEKQRSYSVQMDADRNEEAPTPKMRRAETMPYQRRKETVPEKGSRLRTTAYPTPDPSPEREQQQQPQPRKFDYGQSQAYADDVEYASPDGYEVPASSRYATEELKPQRAASHKRDRYAEPSVSRKDSRGRQRSSSKQQGTSAAQPPSMPRTNSTQYVYRDEKVEPYVRPSLTRESSSRAGQLYGEVPTTSTSRSPGQTRARYSPPAAEPSYTRSFAAEPLNMQTGYKTKERPSLYRRETPKQAVR